MGLPGGGGDAPSGGEVSLHHLRGERGGSGSDLHSATSSTSLPSIRKTPKKRRLSLRSLFRRRRGDPKRKSRALQGGGVDGIASSSWSVRCACFATRDRFPDIMTCTHRSCADCLRQYLRIEISESRVNISCPECSERFNPHDIRIILADPPLMEKYEEFMLRRWLVADPDCRWCPAPDCGYAVIAFGCASCPKITCGRDGCATEFCYHCKQLWHPNQCYRVLLPLSSSLSYSQESGATADDIKPCPRCAAYIIKMNDGSCNHMTCAVCGCEFCWLCMKEISDLHYLSPSGCTFWGKKPWSRKKKILWQLGTLVGAPVGIALIAGIAIPAMIIGIPVYVGRKIHNRYEGKDISKHKRNLVIAGGVTLSVIVSPVVAAVTVGIGVPIMLAYVYGVVPISLCRSGGCGVSAGNGKGVRIEFDDENEMNVASGAAATDTTSVVETRHNPSIGEGSVGGASLSASGSHMERMGAMRDTLSENASTMALAGASITGSLSGSTTVNCYNRLEVQADVQKERCSLSGESATVSLGTVSLGTVSDNASTKAMAGSILNYTLLDREGSVEVDIEDKQQKKLRHHSNSSSLDDASSGGAGVCPSGCPHESRFCSSKWAKDPASSGGKKSRKKLRSRKTSGGGTQINERREDMDAQLLEQRSTNSSEFESPSLSGSLPSVADSHCSLSEFSCSDPETSRPPPVTACCQDTQRPLPTLGSDLNVTPLPEVENDRLENCPAACSAPLGPEGGLGGAALLYIAESLMGATLEEMKETNNNHVDAPPQSASPVRGGCIQTDI
ncbi:hypothetical protein UPYG_G00330520 [Umbra pygmaea]|uniref:RBR-type E3 ubiquitin transferase n=1 Tax=Umbra pygmaea TaxID=75934 RepID=A0ABD0VWF7_UMBPY